MVARIKIGASLSRSFFYNENKVKEGVASCLLAQNFPISNENMNTLQKLNVLQKVSSLRESLKASTVHISLNFDPSEKLLEEKLKDIANLYMEKIGFKSQPYLIYQHNDSGHPHIHILTTKVDWNGKSIDTNFIARNKSEPARKEIEILFGLIKAEDSKKVSRLIKPAYVETINYGKSESKRAIESVLNEVINNYKYTSLPELNAVLNLYNVRADRGTQDSITFKNNGLHYKITDLKGNPVGVPIKASLFGGKPTLKYLEGQFKNNDSLRLPNKFRVKNAIDYYFLKNKDLTIEGLTEALRKEGIQSVQRRNEKGILYGMTYVDHKTKCVFNGSALGKIYSANGILERLKTDMMKPIETGSKRQKDFTNNHSNISEAKGISESSNDHKESLLTELMSAENLTGSVPYELSGKKKRRRKRKSK